MNKDVHISVDMVDKLRRKKRYYRDRFLASTLIMITALMLAVFYAGYLLGSGNRAYAPFGMG